MTDSGDIAVMVGELLSEIMERLGNRAGDVTTSWISTNRTCDINSRHHRLPR
jgi:hypothetical protein